MTISPNLGAIGAPQLGHFKDCTPEGAMIGPEADLVDLEALDAVLFPHLVQNAVPSGSSAPQLPQYTFIHQLFSLYDV
jgi:hypothetical protein